MLTFGWSLANGYVYDDFAIFSAELWRPPWTRPLTLATFLLDARFASPVLSHAINVALHGAAVLLAYSALRRLLPERSAVAAAAIFALLARKERLVKPALSAMVGLSLISGVWVWWAANTTAGSQAGAQALWTPGQYFSAQGVAILRYLWMLLVPVNLSAAPQIPTTMPWAWIGVLAVAAAAFRTRIGWWVLAGLVLLLPSSSIFPANDLAADRRMYLPMLAFASGLSLLPLLDKRWVPVLLAALSLWRVPVWRSEQSFWTDVLQHDPGSVRARIHLGRAGDIAHLEDAKKIAPDDPLVASELGRAHLSAGRYAEALAEFGRALALAPNNPQALSNRGVALLMLKQTEAARADFERALKVDPCHFESRFNLRQLGIDTPAAGCSYTGEQQAALEKGR